MINYKYIFRYVIRMRERKKVKRSWQELCYFRKQKRNNLKKRKANEQKSQRENKRKLNIKYFFY